MTTENLSLLETKHLVEKSRGKLTMMVLRDDRKFLVSIPEVVDSAPNSEDDRRQYSSSELEGKCRSGKRRERRECGGLRSEYEQYKVSLLKFSFVFPVRHIRHWRGHSHTPNVPSPYQGETDSQVRTNFHQQSKKHKLMNLSWIHFFLKEWRYWNFVIIFFESRTRAEPPLPKSRDASPVRSTLTRPPARTYAPRRGQSCSFSNTLISCLFLMWTNSDGDTCHHSWYNKDVTSSEGSENRD